MRASMTTTSPHIAKTVDRAHNNLNNEFTAFDGAYDKLKYIRIYFVGFASEPASEPCYFCRTGGYAGSLRFYVVAEFIITMETDATRHEASKNEKKVDDELNRSCPGDAVVQDTLVNDTNGKTRESETYVITRMVCPLGASVAANVIAQARTAEVTKEQEVQKPVSEPKKPEGQVSEPQKPEGQVSEPLPSLRDRKNKLLYRLEKELGDLDKELRNWKVNFPSK